MSWISFTKRRGVSSIVGGMIFLLLMSSGISVYFLSLESQAEILETHSKLANSQLKKIQEDFDVSATTDEDDNDRLAIQVVNNSPHLLEIADIWIINKTDASNDYPASRYFINYDDTIIPTGYGRNILENTPLYMNPDKYEIKVISTLGTVKTKTIDTDGNKDLKVELIAIPPDVEIGQNVTLAMRVTNVGENEITNVTPFDPPTVHPISGVLASKMVSENSTALLKPGETAIFRWNYRITGTEGSSMIFTSNATGTILGMFNVTSNNDWENVLLSSDPNDLGDLIILTQDLLNRPELFMMVPGPFGEPAMSETDDKAIWGVNVVNPTNSTMNVTKVTINAFAPGANNNNLIFLNLGLSNCLPESIYPPGSTSWECSGENQLIWKDVTAPISIPPYSVYPFVAKASAGQGHTENTEAAIVTTSVFTTVGAFGKAGYESSMNDPKDSMVNVYMGTIPDTRDSDYINSTRIHIPENSEQKFNIILADMDDESDTHVKPGASLIINVPRDWTNVKFVSQSNFNNSTLQFLSLGDGSHQISGKTNSHIGGGGPQTATITFNATAPDVDNKQMYIMYVLANGQTNTDPADEFSLGPLSEIVLQVIP